MSQSQEVSSPIVQRKQHRQQQQQQQLTWFRGFSQFGRRRPCVEYLAGCRGKGNRAAIPFPLPVTFRCPAVQVLAFGQSADAVYLPRHVNLFELNANATTRRPRRAQFRSALSCFCFAGCHTCLLTEQGKQALPNAAGRYDSQQSKRKLAKPQIDEERDGAARLPRSQSSTRAGCHGRAGIAGMPQTLSNPWYVQLTGSSPA